ncbi:MAG: hypothetical protein ABR928_02145 [Terracidiphilus sp.]|jgi:hypothetical protein
MRFLEHNAVQQTQPGGGPDSNGALDEIRSRADQMLAAGDEAIRRALSRGDSGAFLRAGRQQGGE